MVKRARCSLVMPPVTYGYVHHVMDFPGSINIHYEHFIQYVLDICKSLAYHGFKKMILINGQKNLNGRRWAVSSARPFRRLKS